MKKEYELLLKNNNTIKCNIRELMKYNPKLLLLDSNDKELYNLNNIQSLYLYPLSVIDYINNLSNKKIIFLNIIEIDETKNYQELFNKNEFKFLKAVEILVTDNYNDKQINKICDIIKYLSTRNILISLNIKNLNNLKDSMINYLKYITYFKIFLYNQITSKDYQKFLEKLNLIRNNSSNDALLHIKTYMNLNQIESYASMIDNFIEVGVDIFQVSKELIPLDTENIPVTIKHQNIIRDLEKKYCCPNKCQFISVKDISSLYYPRFELDERNSRICYASKMKPYLYNNNLLPCKVSKVLSNINKWQLNYDNSNKLNSVLEKCGASCDDCASIFENDLLYAVEKIININKCHIVLKEQ